MLALSKSVLINDSIARRDKQFASLDIRKEFQYREQNILNTLLKKDNEVKGIYLFVAVIISLMAIMILLLVWNNLKRSRKHLAYVQQLNQEIAEKHDELYQTLQSLEQSHEENSKVIRVLAHDLKNPLAAIKMMVESLLWRNGRHHAKKLEIVQAACSSSLSMVTDLIKEKRGVEAITKKQQTW